jgi:hypothetical protein
MRKPSLVVTALSLIAMAVSFGCAKPTAGTQQQQQNSLAYMMSTLQLPVPNNAYAAFQATEITISGSNVTDLVAHVVDPVAYALKEPNLVLKTTVNNGQRSNGNLTIIYTPLSAELDAAMTDSNKTMTWNYRANTVSPYFTGTSSMLPGAGNLTFPASKYTGGLTVQWASSAANGQVIRTVTVTSTASSVGYLNFVETFGGTSQIPAVTLTGKVGNANITGQWDSSSGGFTDVDGTQKCWNSQLANVICPKH